MKKNVKIFLAGGIPLGIFMTAAFSCLYGINTGLTAGLVSGLSFGVLSSTILGTIHRRAVEKIAGDISEGSTAIAQVRTVELWLPYDRAFELCLRSLELIGRSRIREEDRSRGRITARTSVNWKTWGDTISFDISVSGSEKTAVRVSSRPTARSTLVDFGKNLQNVKTIVSFLERSKR